MSEQSRKEKRKIIDEIKSKIKGSKSVLFINFKGINVAQDTQFRKDFSTRDVEYRIYKNRFIKIALDELGIKGYNPEFFKGSTSVAFGKDEVGPSAILFKTKMLVPCLEAKFGIVNGEFVDVKKLEELSKIPKKDVLISMLLRVITSPISALARVLDRATEKMKA